MFESSFSENLKKFRKDNNLTQEALANMLQVSRTTIIGYEKGAIEPTLYVAFRAATIMNCSLDALVGIDNPTNRDLLQKKLENQNALDFDKSIKEKLGALDELIKKYRRSFEELTMSKKRNDRMLDELIMSKKRNDLMYEELKRTINRVSKTEDEFMSFMHNCGFNENINSVAYADSITNIEIPTLKSFNYISVPEYGSIACGNPNEIEDNLINTVQLPVIKPLNKKDSHEYFIITASGESMNQICQDGEKIILKSTPYGYIPNPGDILAIAIDDIITLKEFTIHNNTITLNPKSNNPEYKEIQYGPDDFYKLEIKGKFICTVKHIESKAKELNK